MIMCLLCVELYLVISLDLKYILTFMNLHHYFVDGDLVLTLFDTFLGALAYVTCLSVCMFCFVDTKN
jgi:hypothetical protein